MTESIVSKWNARYAFSGAPVPAPAAVLSRAERWLPTVGGLAVHAVEDVAADLDATVPGYIGANAAPVALDLACGRAGNAYWLAQRGFIVSAWDISDAAIDIVKSRKPQLLHDVQVRDVVARPPEENSFDVIVVSCFLDRGLCPLIESALKAGGLLMYQTFTQGLSNSDYMLKPNELLDLFGGLCVLDHHEQQPDKNGKAQAMLIARKP